MNSDHRKINIALDGFSSCGKSTIAKRLAADLGYMYVDTGAMYRAVTLYSLRHGLWSDGEPRVQELEAALGDIRISFGLVDGVQHTFLNGKDVEREIRQMEVSDHVSPISTIPAVRRYLVTQQQAIARAKGVVMDGRDVGTVVMPDAELKVFVTADVDTRAQRRYDELIAKGEQVTYDEVLANLKRRDQIDSHREMDPLRMAYDAVLLDNSKLTIDEQQAVVHAWVDEIVEKGDGQ